MNIYELEKQATPGPIRVLDDECGFWTQPKPQSQTEREANSKLLAHCRNNFMKALAALRECSTHSNSHCMSRCTLDTVLRRINAINEKVKTALKELEEVK